ncbi:MAG: histidinol dehydrogenase [Bacteroidota bacterium]
MQTILYPEKETWVTLCRRPDSAKDDIDETVRKILFDVKTSGDKALHEYSMKFDKIKQEKIRVSRKEIMESGNKIPEKLKEAINTAYRNIEKFHMSQLCREEVVVTMPGIRCWRKNAAIEKVGLYIPGGSAPLFSSVLMLGIPARIAGCRQIIMCTPPGRTGNVDPLILYAASLTGISEIYKIGGAQAIAAMVYGTETVPKVNKIFGPGNQYVTRAKEMVQADGVAIDMPAGPSEVLVIADKTADPEFVAADLLSQSEHGPDSQVVLVTDSRKILPGVMAEIKKQIKLLPRKDIAEQALNTSLLILMPDLEQAISFSNEYAPEHLIINCANAAEMAEKVINAGSVFIGKYSCESAGDYASGTNHTLPTNGYAKCYCGVSVESFMRKITFQEITKEGIRNIGPAVELMAEAESLAGHANAVKIRLKKTENVWFR